MTTNRIDIQKLQQSQQNKKIDSQKISNSGKSFEEVLNQQRLKNEPSLQNPAADSPKTLSVNDIQLRQYGLNIKPVYEEITFSKHAKQRLAQRNIDIDSGLIEKISGAVRKASEKSIRNALVLSGESAFIVSVDNNVVVTAMNNQEMRESVITNIDGTVIL